MYLPYLQQDQFRTKIIILREGQGVSSQRNHKVSEVSSHQSIVNEMLPAVKNGLHEYYLVHTFFDHAYAGGVKYFAQRLGYDVLNVGVCCTRPFVQHIAANELSDICVPKTYSVKPNCPIRVYPGLDYGGREHGDCQ